MSVATTERPVTLCEIAAVMAFARDQVYGHWRDGQHSHEPFCACPTPNEASVVWLGTDRADRLVVLLTKFAYQIHTPDEQAEMLALIKEAT